MSNTSEYNLSYFKKHKERIYKKRIAHYYATVKYKTKFCVSCNNSFVVKQGMSKKNYCGDIREKGTCAYNHYKEIKEVWVKNNTYYISQKSRAYQLRKKCIGGVISSKDWEKLKSDFNYTCAICLKREPDIKLTQDHKIPVSKGGANTIDNIQPLCQPCNSSKNNKVWFARCDLNLSTNEAIDPRL